MGVAVKRLRIGRRRAQVATSSPLELALAPALVDGSWRVPDRFNLTRDLVEVLGRDPKRRALTILGLDGIIEPRSFRQLAEGAARWAHILRGKGVEPGDRVVVLSRLNEDWVDIALGCIKVGAIFAPAAPTISPQALESRVAVTDAALVVAGEESEETIERMAFTPEVHHVRSGRMRRASDVPDEEPTADTLSRDIAFLAWTAGTEGDPKPVAHTHGSLFAARATAQHWLDPDSGDLVWCATGPGSALALTTLAGAWVHGAEAVLHEGDFDAAERLDLIRRVGPSVLCQSPLEYGALAGLRQLARSRPPQLRRLVATGDYLEPTLLDVFREQWGLEIHAAYGETETGVVATTGQREDRERLPGEIGSALPGHHLGVVDDHGNELPPGVEGALAVRGRPPTLFAGYWESPEETKRAFRGDWYLTGDIATAVEPGTFRFLARAGELITSRGRTFGPHEVERALAEHPAVAASAVVGVRDLERGGQFVRAFVVLEAGVASSEQLEAELRQFVGQSLPEQQVPREIEFVDSLPHSPGGALRRAELRDRPASGRPLWEAPPTSEPEPEPPTTVELETSSAPDFLVAPDPAPEPRPSIAAAGAPDGAAVVAPLEEAVAQPLPAVEAAPEIAAEAVAGGGEVVPSEPAASVTEPPLAAAAPPTVETGRLSPHRPESSSPLAAAGPPAVETPPSAPAPERSAAPPPLGEALSSPGESPRAEELAEPAPPPPGPGSPPLTGLGDPLPPPTVGAVTEHPDLAQVAAPGPQLDPPTDAASEHVPETPVATAADGVPSPVGLAPDSAQATPRHLPEFPSTAELAGPGLQAEGVSARAAPSTPGPEPLAEPPVEEDARPRREDRAEAAPLAPDAPASAPDPPAAPPEPLPDYIVSSAEAYARRRPLPAPEPAPTPEAEDLGPLPEYIVDPERRLEVVGEAPTPAAPPPAAPPPPATGRDIPPEGHPLAGLARAHVSIPIPADDEQTPKPSRRRTRGRSRPAPPADSPRKQGRWEGEPGDEGLETGWMQRLSSRLDAYKMSEEEAAARRRGTEAGDAPADDSSST